MILKSAENFVKAEIAKVHAWWNSEFVQLKQELMAEISKVDAKVIAVANANHFDIVAEIAQLKGGLANLEASAKASVLGEVDTMKQKLATLEAEYLKAQAIANASASDAAALVAKIKASLGAIQ
jgi:hypothetical protein